MLNPKQLATIDEARAIARILTDRPEPVGGGVAPEMSDGLSSGIYVPAWGHPSGEWKPQLPQGPDGGTLEFLHLRFLNGAEGFNVGLIREMFSACRDCPALVIAAIAAEVDSNANATERALGRSLPMSSSAAEADLVKPFVNPEESGT